MMNFVEFGCESLIPDAFFLPPSLSRPVFSSFLFSHPATDLLNELYLLRSSAWPRGVHANTPSRGFPLVRKILINSIAQDRHASEPVNGIGSSRNYLPTLVGLLTAFGFGAVAAHQRKDKISRLRGNHAKERETILMNAERAKAKTMKRAHQETLQEVRRTSNQAKIKVGLAFAAAAGIVGLLLLTQFMTLGLLMLTTAGGALGGYMAATTSS